jgi:cytochrome oxidase Cu insertion factor (SCO1/SenC/PrrC family)
MPAFVAAVALLVAAAFSGISAESAPPHSFVPLMRQGDVVPDIPLIDQDGNRLSLRAAAGLTIVSFVYTRCPDVCSLVTAKFASLSRTLGATGIRLVEITLDPAYDRPPVLRRYADAAGARGKAWFFGTGRPADIRELAERFGVATEDEGDKRAAARGRLAHTETVAIVSGSGVLTTLIAGDDWSADDVAAQARADAALPSNPLQRIALQLFTSFGAACGGHAAGGLPAAAAFGIFASCVAAMGWLVLRLFASALRDNGKAS